MAKIESLGVKRVVVREGNKERRGTLYIGSGSQESVIPPVCQSQCDYYVSQLYVRVWARGTICNYQAYRSAKFANAWEYNKELDFKGLEQPTSINYYGQI